MIDLRPPLALPTARRPTITLALVVAAAAGWLVAARPELVAPRLPDEAAGIVILLAGVAAIGALWARPAAGAPLLVAFVYLNLSQLVARHFDVPSLLRLLVLVLVVAAWRTADRGAARSVLAQPLTAALVAYTGIALASTTWAADPALADARFWELAKALVLYLLLAALAGSRPALRRSVWALVGSAAALSVLGLWQHLRGAYDNEFWGLARVKHAQIYGEVFEPRIAGPLGDPNFFAQALLVAVPLAAALVFRERRPAPRFAAAAAAAVIAATLVLTYSRGAGLALGLQLVLLVALARHRRRAAIVAVGVAGLLALLAPAELGQRLATVRELLPGADQQVLEPDSSFEERRLVTKAAWEMFLAHPWRGVGAGNYTVHFPAFAERVGSPERFYDAPGGAHYPHSLYLEIAAETGVPGLAAFALVVAACAAALWRSRRALLAGGRADAAAIALALEIGLAGYLVSSLFLHGHFLRYLWLIFGLAAALARVAAAPDEGGDGA